MPHSNKQVSSTLTKQAKVIFHTWPPDESLGPPSRPKTFKQVQWDSITSHKSKLQVTNVNQRNLQIKWEIPGTKGLNNPKASNYT